MASRCDEDRDAGSEPHHLVWQAKPRANSALLLRCVKQSNYSVRRAVGALAGTLAPPGAEEPLVYANIQHFRVRIKIPHECYSAS